MTACDKCGAGPDKQVVHQGFGKTTVILCKACGRERDEK
jgi:hypothetical protein